MTSWLWSSGLYNGYYYHYYKLHLKKIEFPYVYKYCEYAYGPQSVVRAVCDAIAGVWIVEIGSEQAAAAARCVSQASWWFRWVIDDLQMVDWTLLGTAARSSHCGSRRPNAAATAPLNARCSIDRSVDPSCLKQAATAVHRTVALSLACIIQCYYWRH